ncbi:MAG: hypothetical protein HN894_03025, partial [Bacteroidetes bacterium]|nr:hypothetical protein [Bacteroidota bacterium]
MKRTYFALKSSILVVLMTLLFSNFGHSQLVTIGTGTIVNTNTTYPAPYGNYYMGARHQMLILASEISAGGAGNGFIQSVAFDVVTANASNLGNFEIKIGATTLTSLTTWAPGLTSVYLNNYIETTGWNTHMFTTPFLWDGFSNIIIETCFYTSTPYTYNAVINQSTTAFNSTVEYQMDNTPAICATTLQAYWSPFMQRPNMQLDILPAVQSNENLGMTSWDSPAPNLGLGLTATTPITITYKNWGLATQNIYTLSYSIDNGASFVTETVTTPILPDSFLTYTFTTTADFSVMAAYDCIAAVYLSGDTINYNDTIDGITVLSIATISSFPYLENFESGNFWISGGTSSSWEFGTPAGSTISGAYSGSNCWATNLTGVYNNYEDSWVESIIFDMTSLTAPVFEFKYWIDAQGMYYDGVKVQYTLDGGLTWLHLGSEFGDPLLDPNGTNWYNGMSIAGIGYVNGWTGNGTGWVNGKYLMTTLAGEPSVKFRVCFGSDSYTQYNGFAFDDLMIYQLPDNDASVVSFYGIESICEGFNDVYAIITNLGNNAINNVDVMWEVDGVSQTTYAYTNTLLTTEVDTILLGSYNFISGNIYEVKGWTYMPNNLPDDMPLNDTAIISNMQTAFAGTYTIGATGDYPDFTTAVDVLTTVGLCGPVIFNVETGVYTERIGIPEIIGNNATNTITFQSLSGDSTDVVLQWPTGSSDNSVFKASGVDYLTIQNMTIKSTSAATYGRVIDQTAGSTYNTYKNNVIESIVATSSLAAPFYDHATNNDHCTIANNRILNGYYGIYKQGISSSNQEDGNVYKDNIIEGYYYYGIYSYYQKNIIIDGNTVTNGANTGVNYPIYMYYNDYLTCINNKVFMSGTSSQYGIRPYYCDGDATNPNIVANNMISQWGSPTATVYGIYHYYSSYTDYINNSVLVAGGSPLYGRALYAYGTTTYSFNNFVNNIFANTGGGQAAYINSAGWITELDHNNLFTTGSVLGYYGGNQADITAWQTATGTAMSNNSVSVNPGFAANNDLHVYGNATMNDLGTPWPGIIYDIDGELRDTITPDMGADEYAPAAIDIGVAGLLNPIPEMCYDSAELISVLVQNYGLDTIDFSIDTLFIEASVSGTNPVIFPTVEINVGTLASGESLEIVLSTAYDMSANGSYTFDAFSTLSNDGIFNNNAMGTVTINVFGINALPYAEDFETFTSGNPGSLANGWSRNPASGMAWMPDMGGTSSSATGPNIDHTTGSTSGIYVYMETSSGTTGDSAFFMPPCASIASKQLSFWYHMYGATMGTLGVQEFVNGGWSTIWSLTGQQTASSLDPWVEAIVLFSPTANTFRFYGVRGTSYSGDMAIDDVLIIQPLPNDASVEIAYTFGTLPLPSGTPTEVSAWVKNWGFNPQTNLDVTLSLSGDNTFTDVFTIANLAPYADTFITFNVYSPTVIGNNTVTVSVPADDNLTNNTWQYNQITTAETYNYCDTAGATNFLGWTAGNDGIFLSKYTINGSKTVEYVNVRIGDDNTVGQTVYAVVIDTGGVVVGESAPVVLTAADTGAYYSFPILVPSLTLVVNTDVYVGLAATNSSNGTAYYALGLQEEDPGRDGAFYYTDLTGGAFTELNDFGRYMIEAELGDPPPFEAYLIGFISPDGGCGLSASESFTMQIQNTGTDTISGGLSASIGFVGGTIYTENVPGIIYPGNIITFTFAQTFDLTVLADTTFEFIGWIDLVNDPMQLNDTALYSVDSWWVPPGPLTFNDTIPYGTSGTVSASAPYTLYWFEDETSLNFFSLDTFVNTPILYDTATYWVEAATGSSGTYDVGTGTAVGTSYSYPTPYGQYYNGSKEQYLIPASELLAMGMLGEMVQSIAFDVVTPAGASLNDYTISIGTTQITSLTTWQTGLVDVYYNSSYATTAGWNVHAFTDPWVWDGVSNIIIQTCFDNYPNGYTTNGIVKHTTTTYPATINMHSDGGGVCPSTTLYTYSYNQRPNIQIYITAAGCPSVRLPVHCIVEGIPDYDAGVTVITEPFTGLLLGNEEVTIEVLNYGVQAISNFDVAYVLNGQAPVIETITANLNSGDSYIYTFATLADLSVFGVYDFVAYPMLSGDTIAVNDTAYATVENLPLQYCVSSATSNTYEEIINVDLSNLSNYSGPSNGAMYTDFTLLPAVQLAPGMTYPVSITTDFFTYTTQFSCWVKVYIDWNRDAVYDELTEVAFSSATTSSATVTGIVTVPVTALSGFTGMRVVFEETTIATGVVACGTYTWGETEDYTAMIAPLIPNDAGVVEILSPVAIELENTSVPVEVIIRNFGTDTLTACDIAYELNGGTPQFTPWTGSLPTFDTDTVTLLPNIICPGGYNDICAYTIL